MRYKNITNRELAVIGLGIVAAGAEVETDSIIENPNLQVVVTQEPKEVEEKGK